MMYSTPLPLATAAAPDHSAAVVKIGSAVGIGVGGWAQTVLLSPMSSHVTQLHRGDTQDGCENSSS